MFRVSCRSKDGFRRHVQASRPVIVSGIIEQWPALGKWSPSYFKEAFGELVFHPTVEIPSGPEYGAEKRLWADYQREMTVAEFVDFMETARKPCYLQSQKLEKFPGAEDDLDFAGLVPDATETYLWMGKDTHTGMHFDLTDNLLCQVYGNKRLCLLSPNDSRCLYPVPDSPTKSGADPMEPDLESYPNLEVATVYTGIIHPGDILFIPHHWWHSVLSLGESISVTHNFGAKVSYKALFGAVWTAGAPSVLAVTRDFLWYGLLHRKFETRLLDDPPYGKMLYDMIASAISRRVPHLST